jgi:predicted transcriptional regulator
MIFTGVGQSAANGIIKKIKDNVDDEFNDYLLFYQGDFKDQMKALELDKKNDAYVFVLDEKGKIIFKDSGRYSESKLEKIADLVEL